MLLILRDDNTDIIAIFTIINIYRTIDEKSGKAEINIAIVADYDFENKCIEEVIVKCSCAEAANILMNELTSTGKLNLNINTIEDELDVIKNFCRDFRFEE